MNKNTFGWLPGRHSLILLGVSLALAAPSAAQEIRQVPRERTLVSQGWDFYNQIPSPDNFNPYAGIFLHGRNNLHYTVFESLFYSNHNNNDLIPWLAESYEYNDDFTQITVKLNPAGRWSDGEPFSSADVKFTFDMLAAQAPQMLFSGVVAEWVKSVEAPDAQTVVITLTKPGPRWARDYLTQGQAARLFVLPKHIWDGQDPMTFTNFDLAKGWPIGTGPFKIVASSASSVIFDRLDTWWAAEAGVAAGMPAVERVLYVPGTQEAMPQLYASNQIDIGKSITSGAYEAIKFQNPKLESWNEEGPVWGAPDGCTFALRFNTQQPPFDNVALRQAISHVVDRDQIVNLAYEGSVLKAVLPLSSYESLSAYVGKMEAALDPGSLDDPDIDKVAALMETAGYKKDGNGFWASSDGTAFRPELLVAQGDPIGPVLGEQFKTAGFDVLMSVQQLSAKQDAFLSGNFQMDVGPHCGALYDPFQTLEHFHSKYAPEPGGKSTNPRAVTRYANPDYDKLIDQMEAMQPSADDPAYMDLVRQASEIFMRDLPEISLAEELHTMVFNTTYWTGYPNAADPYVAPYLPWDGFALVIHRLKAAD
jgi:peptide/nickel transport system substrate-binding protein